MTLLGNLRVAANKRKKGRASCEDDEIDACEQADYHSALRPPPVILPVGEGGIKKKEGADCTADEKKSNIF